MAVGYGFKILISRRILPEPSAVPACRLPPTVKIRFKLSQAGTGYPPVVMCAASKSATAAGSSAKRLISRSGASPATGTGV